MATVRELRDQFDSHDVHNDTALLTRLKELLEACDRAQCQVPEPLELARAISVARSLMPHSTTPPNSPPQDGSDRAEWLIREAMSVLLEARRPGRNCFSLYGITAFAIDTWLLVQQQGPGRSPVERAIGELWARWEALVSTSHADVLRWMKDLFELCVAERIGAPVGRDVLERLYQAYNLKPDPSLSDNPPEGDQVRWLLGQSVNALARKGSLEDRLHYYDITALAIAAWLAARRDKAQ